MASKNGQGHMRVQRGAISYTTVSVCLCVATIMAIGWSFQIEIKHTHFPAQLSNTSNTRIPPPRCPWATRPIHARCPKRLPLVLGVVGVWWESRCVLQKQASHHTQPPPPPPPPPAAAAATTATFSTIIVEGVHRGTHHLQAAEPRRRGGWGGGRFGCSSSSASGGPHAALSLR